MKRPIKFRFWCNAGKAFIQQYNYNGAVDELFDEKEWDILTPSQYTGCNDYNGKEIYEGDVIEFERNFVHSPEPEILRAVIEYVDGAYIAKTINPPEVLPFTYLYAFYKSYRFTGIFRVIGNKFENPELLV